LAQRVSNTTDRDDQKQEKSKRLDSDTAALNGAGETSSTTSKVRPIASGKPKPKPTKEKPVRFDAPLTGAPFRPAGFSREGYHIVSAGTGMAQVYSRRELATIGTLLDIHPDDAYWRARFPTAKDTIDTAAAAFAIAKACAEAGQFEPQRLRGRGCWRESDGRIIVNVGDAVWDGGRKVALNRVESDYIYDRGVAIDFDPADALDDATAAKVADIGELYAWIDPVFAMLVPGWLTIAPLCGLLEWRPHIWFQCAPRSGKSTLLNNYIVPLCGGFGRFFDHRTTEPGMRRANRVDALPACVDELEPGARTDGVTGLMRSCSTNTTAITAQSNRRGTVELFGLYGMYAAASVRDSIEGNIADESRISIAAFGPSSPAQWRELERLLADVCTPLNGRRLVARTLAQFERSIAPTAEALRLAARDKFGDERMARQVSIMLAASLNLKHEWLRLEVADARAWLDRFDWSGIKQASAVNETEHERFLRTLASRTIPIGIGSRRLAVRELVALACMRREDDDLKATAAEALLRRYGVWPRAGGSVWISNDNPNLVELMAGTAFPRGWQSILRQRAGAWPDRRGGERGWAMDDFPGDFSEPEPDAADAFARFGMC
jgi:putative DNA primase/helicase